MSDDDKKIRDLQTAATIALYGMIGLGMVGTGLYVNSTDIKENEIPAAQVVVEQPQKLHKCTVCGSESTMEVQTAPTQEKE